MKTILNFFRNNVGVITHPQAVISLLIIVGGGLMSWYMNDGYGLLPFIVGVIMVNAGIAYLLYLIIKHIKDNSK
jgi:hypothetical protein